MLSSHLQECLPVLQNGSPLEDSLIKNLIKDLIHPDVSPDEKAVFLSALNQKGETASEVAAFAREFRTLARDPGLSKYSPRAIDVCGTGGDHSGSFNVSTAVAFFLAAGGVPVVKHGNRSVTSLCGSADLLEAIGIPLALDNPGLQEMMGRTNFVFLFAPAFHPAFKEIVPVRKALAAKGQRTIFNILGPLLNPAKPAHQLLGVFDSERLQPMAEALGKIGLKAYSTGSAKLEGGQSLDELTVCGDNFLVSSKGTGLPNPFQADDVGLHSASIDSLKGGDASENLRLLKALLEDRAPPGLRDTVLLNAGFGFWLVEEVESPLAGIEHAKKLWTDGKVKSWLIHLEETCAKIS